MTDTLTTITENAEVQVDTPPSSADPIKQRVEDLAQKQKEDQNLLLIIMGGIVVFVVITFCIEIYSMNSNYIQDKTILLQNNQLNKDYFDKVLFINNEVQDLKTQIEVLKAKNPYLK